MAKVMSAQGLISEINVQKIYEGAEPGAVTVQFTSITDKYGKPLTSDSMEPIVVLQSNFKETVEMWESMFDISGGRNFELSIKGMQPDVDALSVMIDEACARHTVLVEEL